MNARRQAAEALRPFARHAESYTSFDGQHDYLDDDEIAIGAFKGTVGDLRRAATALAAIEAEAAHLTAVPEEE